MIDPKNQNQNIQDPNIGIDKKSELKKGLANSVKFIPSKSVGDDVDKMVKKKTQDSEKKSAKQIFIGFISFVLGLIAVAYAVVLWSLMEGGLSNSLFSALGMRPDELKFMLLTVTSSLFGTISLIFVIATLIKFFQWIMTSSKSTLKKQYLKRMGGYFAILSLFIGIWVGLYWVISHAEANPVKQGGTSSLIITSPRNVIGLTAPMSVKFDIGENLYKKIPVKFIRQIEWDLNNDDIFGDASGASITHRFLSRGNNNGRFVIKAKVFYFSQSSNEEKVYVDQIEVIIANEAVNAVLETNVSKGAIPLTVKFNADKSADPDGNIVQYEWDFDGDGTYEIRGADKSSVEYIFTKIGEHNVSLRITGQNNDFAVSNETITALAAENKIRADISSENSLFEGVVPLSIELDGSQSYTKSGSIVKYEWFVKGDTKTYVGRTIKRIFDVPGEYDVTLVVENKDGDKDRLTQKILVHEKRSVVITTSSEAQENGFVEGIVPFEVEFDSSASEIPRAVEWKWDFDGDGIYDEFSQKVRHIYRAAGEYTAELVITDSNNNEYKTTQNVLVSDAGAIARISSSPSAGEVPLTVEFDGSGSKTSSGEIIDYVWEFQGESPIHYGSKISREFRAIGVFPVKLTILTSNGERSEVETFVSVRGKSLQASFDASPLVGDAPLEVVFNSQKSTGDIREYYWTFGDSQESYLSTPKHTYNVPGEYIVRLKTTDSRSIVSEVEKRITVTEPKKEE